MFVNSRLLLSVCVSALLVVTVTVLLTFGQSALAQPIKLPSSEPSADENVVPQNIVAGIVTRLREARSDIDVSNVRPSPISGIYKVDLNGQLAFVSEDGGFIISGEMYQVNPGYLVNLQDQERQQQEIALAPERAKLLAAVNKKDMVTYYPKGETKGHIFVFTDIDCGFCRKLHGQMDAMLEKGIEVRYLAFPRAGVRSRSAEKLATTWCSENPREMMDRFKGGENVALAVCDSNPIADQYMLAQDLGVRGTPAIILESGQLIPGFVEAERLAKAMGIE